MPDAKLVATAAAAVMAVSAFLLRRRLCCLLSRRASVTLTYFDISGLGEPIRLALSVAQMPFEDKRLERDEFLALKPKLRFGQVPCLQVGSEELFQSSAILRYIGQAFDMSGAESARAL
jgi:hypothetical protein